MIRFSVEYRIDGHNVSPGQWADSFRQQAIDHITATVRTMVEAVQCPDHHVHACLTTAAPTHWTRTMAFAVDGCCDKLAQMTRAALR